MTSLNRGRLQQAKWRLGGPNARAGHGTLPGLACVPGPDPVGFRANPVVSMLTMIRDHHSNAVAAGFLLAALASPVVAQVPSSDSGKAGSRLVVHAPFFIPFFHHRRQAGRAFSAEPDSTAFLRVEAGYDGNYRSPELDRDLTSSISLEVTPSSRFELDADLDFWALEAAPGAGTVRGRGDAHLTVQWTAFTIRPGDVAVALAYIAKLPAANRGTLGTGRVDHRLLVPVSFAFKGVQVDAHLGADADATPAGFDWGPEGAVSVTIDVIGSLSAHAGLSGQVIDTDQPAGGYVSGGITWQAGHLTALDLGARHGVTKGAPSYGLIGGISIALVTRRRAGQR
ncbi:MAG TPA: hypothetical protein VN719_05495 [Gemmatimonadales bacterium]|nr:hypothetical protein [Gemmatimonadales bacterium]